MVILKTTQSICPKCFKKIDATIFSKNGSVFMKKFCEKHGLFEVLLEKNKNFYESINRSIKKDYDHFIKNIKVPITSKCNLNCKFCYLPYRNNKKDLTFFKKIVDCFPANEVLISGGEPTLRNDLFDLIYYIKKKGKKPILVTNGLKLKNKAYVKKLKESGLSSVCLPLNSLNNNISKLVEGSEVLESKLKALNNLKENKIGIILGSVLIKGINDSELESIFDYCLSNLDHLLTWRIKIGVELGRYKLKEPLFISEILELLCGIFQDRFGFNINLNFILRYLKKRKNYSNLLSCKFTLFLVFWKNGKNISLMDINLERPQLIYYYFKVLLIIILNSLFKLNFKRFFNQFKDLIFGHRKTIKVFPIRIRRWPTKFTLDLNELKYCRSLGLAEDGKVYPFCYSLILNERIINKNK